HERGAFTGATEARAGVFEAAHGGTLFVDEIGDLELPLQAKLLRAIERKEIKRVGSNQVRRVDVRVFAATRRDLEREIQARRFRDDLYYRLAVARLELPPLRRRVGDIAFLTHYFWRSFGGDARGPTPDTLQRFEAHDWPGNVRELANAVARLLALGDVAMAVTPSRASATSADFIDRVVADGVSLPVARQRVAEELEVRYVRRALELHGNNVTRAAASSGVGRRYFQMLRAKR
ncbi:MAG: sigma 54-interacting transcriptional regulator, partial [Myxococcales bacterium]|nr:sigma 54-interacting transcriptional regulator [Myxococcales bacterium]